MARGWLDHCLGVVVLGACSGCIVSVDGLTGGPSDASADMASDTTFSADGPVDSSHEGSLDSSLSDGRRPIDSGSTADVACLPVVFDAGSAIACPPADGASCFAQALPGFQPMWVPPRPTISPCTSTQISTFVADCLGTGMASCSTFQMDPTNASCLNCLNTPLSTPSAPQSVYGPLLQGMNFALLNIGGCIALTDPCQLACAEVWEAKTQCEVAACGSVCPVTDATSGAAYEACISEADGCSCLPQASEAEACEQALLIGPAAECFPNMSFVASAQILGMLFCGGGN
jgi:hypothetical protein